MEELDYFDDIDDCFYIECNAEDDSVSRLCTAIYDATNNLPIGTGVLISSDGLFISAGHNFKNDDIKVEAYYAGRNYDVDVLYKEYDRTKLLDFAVGKLQAFNSQYCLETTMPILYDCSDLNVGSQIKIAGYKSTVVQNSDIIEEINPIEGVVVLKQRKEFSIISPDCSQRFISEILDGRGIFYMKCGDADAYKGFSGGPVYFDNKIYGIVISHYFLKSDYIRDMLRSITDIYTE